MPYKRDPLARLLAAELAEEGEAFDVDLWRGGAPDALQLIPVPLRDCPEPTTVPTPGCFYQIRYGTGGLLTTTGRAYDVGPGSRRLDLAGVINNHPYNRRFWVTGVWPFEDGQISFNPRFTSGFTAQARALGDPPQSPSGRSFAILWIPPVPAPASPEIRGNCTEPLILRYWAAAARNAFNAWQRLERLALLTPADARRAWNQGQERVWFGEFSPRMLRTVRESVNSPPNFPPSSTLKIPPSRLRQPLDGAAVAFGWGAGRRRGGRGGAAAARLPRRGCHHHPLSSLLNSAPPQRAARL